MATEEHVNSARIRLQDIWANPPQRNAKFGNALKSLSIKNIRGLSVTVEFKWPVVAIGGTNGSGKTTILQICSSAFTRHGSGKREYKMGRWIGPALAGESPAIRPPAEITYSFWNDAPSVNVPYQVERTRWGYPRRGNPERSVKFVGIADYAPRIERLDRTFQNRNRLNVTNTDVVDPRVLESVSGILGTPYAGASLHTVTIPSAHWTDTMPQLERGGNRYTEPHMGAGEQKIIRLVHSLEALPEKSLLLLEEPELTLHPDAQFGLAWYLMTLACRKGHQIIIATHSPNIFEALPADGRVLLIREAGAVVLHSVSHLSAARQLSSSVRANKDLILVEDEIAQNFLTEVFRRFSPDMLKSACMVPVGNTDDVRRMVEHLRQRRVRVVGVRDPDIGEAPSRGLFSLPGEKSPEELLLNPENIIRAENFLSGVVSAFDLAKMHGVGFSGSKAAKRVFSDLSVQMGLDQGFIADRLTLAWLSSPTLGETARTLITSIKAGLDM